MDAGNRIWIELDKGGDVNSYVQCHLANMMLERLGARCGIFYVVDGKYCFGDNTSSTVLKDGGNWFSLDFLARGKYEDEDV